jgi:PAS domain-containing protein
VVKQTGKYAFWTWDIHNDSISGDNEFYRIVGHEPEAIAHYEDFLSFVHQNDIEQLRDNVSRGLDSREVIDFDFRVMQKDGSTIAVKASGVLRFDEFDHPKEWVGTLMQS